MAVVAGACTSTFEVTNLPPERKDRISIEQLDEELRGERVEVLFAGDSTRPGEFLAITRDSVFLAGQLVGQRTAYPIRRVKFVSVNKSGAGIAWGLFCGLVGGGALAYLVGHEIARSDDFITPFLVWGGSVIAGGVIGGTQGITAEYDVRKIEER